LIDKILFKAKAFILLPTSEKWRIWILCCNRKTH